MDDDVDKKDFVSNNDLCLFNAADHILIFFLFSPNDQYRPPLAAFVESVCRLKKALRGEEEESDRPLDRSQRCGSWSAPVDDDDVEPAHDCCTRRETEEAIN